MAKKWQAVATFRYTHDKVVSVTGDFDDFEDIEVWVDVEYDRRALEHLVITYNVGDERLTLVEIAPSHVPDDHKPIPETADDRLD